MIHTSFQAGICKIREILMESCKILSTKVTSTGERKSAAQRVSRLGGMKPDSIRANGRYYLFPFALL